KGPADVCWSGSQLFVADYGHHRILVYPGLAAATPPAFVIGAAAIANPSNNPPAVSNNTLNAPLGLWCSASMLLVADSGNNRVLEFQLPIVANGIAAVAVIGQQNYAGNSPNRGQLNPAANSLSFPAAVFWDTNKQLYIADTGNHRVVGYATANQGSITVLNNG